MTPYSLSLPKAILFDWDGTLVDTMDLITRAMNAALESVGKPPLTVNDARHILHRSARDSFQDLFGEGWKKAQKVYYQAFERWHLDTLSPFADAVPILDYAKEKNLYLAVVSNKNGGYLRLEVEKLGWNPYFKAVIGATDAPRDKPHPDPALLALKDSGLTPGKDIWFIGDTVTDLGCAHACGFTAVLQRRHKPQANEFPHTPPDIFVENCAALKELLTQLSLH